MSEVNLEKQKYEEDPRIPCKYGSTCYQKNSAHLDKYKHFSNVIKRKKNDANKPGPSKKLKSGSDNENENSKENSEQVKKLECISDSEGESGSEAEDNSNESEILDPKEFIKSKFLVEMPNDFYNFWDYCKDLKPHNPCEALKEIGLKLVGPYDVLAGHFKNVKKSPEEYLRHWRFYYDPPELLTVLKGNNSTCYHIGYFYDSPDEPPSFLVSNYGNKDGILTKMGDNIFAAVNIYLDELKKNSDPFKKMHIGKLQQSLKNKAEKLKLNLSSHSEQIKKRENKVVAKTSNKIGLVVPYKKKTELGYRDLAMPDKELQALLSKLEKASPEQKATYLSELQPVLTYANIALDECDFGTGIKLGWEILFHGIDSLDSTISRFLCNSYKLLKKDAFAKIAEAHMSDRKKGSNLSII